MQSFWSITSCYLHKRFSQPRFRNPHTLLIIVFTCIIRPPSSTINAQRPTQRHGQISLAVFLQPLWQADFDGIKRGKWGGGQGPKLDNKFDFDFAFFLSPLSSIRLFLNKIVIFDDFLVLILLNDLSASLDVRSVYIVCFSLCVSLCMLVV